MNLPHLHDYGIQNEESAIRAHVGVRARTVYVFRTEEAKRIVASMRESDGRFASQPGVAGTTAFGFPVPVGRFNDLRRIPNPTLSTARRNCPSTAPRKGQSDEKPEEEATGRKEGITCRR